VIPQPAFLADLIPRRVHRATWQNLAARLKLTLPCIKDAGSLYTLFFIVAVLPFVWGLLAHLGCILLAGLIPIVAAVLIKIAAPIATEFSSNS